ncbi:MAG: hypothetical protein NC911_03640 [Candidatus Omnitrophica bacterium]|nr:hypothetical protein [Candidatus Omnitrophota bacterium]
MWREWRGLMFPDPKNFSWLEKHTRKVIKHCRRVANFVPGFSTHSVTVYVPGGDDKYPSFWIRDAVMQCRSGLIPAKEMETMIKVTLAFQNRPETQMLANRLQIPPWAIPDHIILPGLGSEEFRKRHPLGPVFYPGTYFSGKEQGNGFFGVRLPDDNLYELVQLVYTFMTTTGLSSACQLLQSSVQNIPVWERLHLGFQAMAVDEVTGLHWNTPTDWAASSFHDALRPMGAIALTSCLRFRAAAQMSDLSYCLGRKKEAEEYKDLAGKLAGAIQRTFQRRDGWLLAATQVNRQPDTWSTAMAGYYGILKGDDATAAAEALTRAYQEGSLTMNGYLRHTPVWADDLPGKTVWEDSRLDKKKPYGWYQFGGYWPQPLGYVCWSIARIDRQAATLLAQEFIDHTIRFADEGAPFEWVNPVVLRDKPGEGKWYGPSAALPLEGFRRLSQEEVKEN